MSTSAPFLARSVFGLGLFVAVAADAAELRLRESLLEAQRDRVSIAIIAVVDHLGVEAHPLVEDCDLHVPLRTREIRVPVLGEIKNACSMPPGVSLAHWSDRLYEETHGLAVPVEGVFRIWLEHPPAGGVVQTESQRVPWYANSNPDHQVELHPITRIGSLNFLDHFQRIAEGNQVFGGYGVPQLQTVLGKKITIQRITVDGEPYVRIQGTKTGFNHWTLRARVQGTPESLPDGLRLHLDMLSGNQVVPGALDIPATALTGTVAFTEAQALVSGSIIRFRALIRINLAGVLDQVGPTPKEIKLPIEFVLLDLE